jgi:hypothetical protein
MRSARPDVSHFLRCRNINANQTVVDSQAELFGVVLFKNSTMLDTFVETELHIPQSSIIDGTEEQLESKGQKNNACALVMIDVLLEKDRRCGLGGCVAEEGRQLEERRQKRFDHAQV